MSGWAQGYEEGKDARRDGSRRDTNPYTPLRGEDRDMLAQAGWARGWEEMDAKLSELESIDLAL